MEIGLHEKAVIYLDKAIQTCKKLNKSTTSWYLNFITAYDMLEKENKKLKEKIINLELKIKELNERKR